QGDVLVDLKRAKPQFILALILGMLLVSLASTIGYIIMLMGHFRCLVHTPERHGARWKMFVCITGIIMSPVLSFVAGFLGGTQMNDRPAVVKFQKKHMLAMQRGDPKVVDAMLDDEDFMGEVFSWRNPHIVLNVASVILSVVSFVASLLFFRAVASC